ncbi:presqualene diphosphate synthase HpnD [Massilia sp. 9096]|uniref:presqualene diphosphate synthase HpnD n=1 Tax=Massilia sp. 9096 TaxID=1500894 RepID=UPI00068E0FF1|nr:presqualene diphosphate synthase HpnD [Massilia sp. 9096]
MAAGLPVAAVPDAPAPRSSFQLALRILPAAQRGAMYEIYAFCRAVDDIADGDTQHGPSCASPLEKRAALERWRQDVHACCAGRGPAHLAALSRHIASFGLARDDFDAVIDGMLMDAHADPVCAPSNATLDLYCDRVASAVGRLAVKVFGMPFDDGVLLAHHLGRALQLTNILRDIDEDAAIGRAYLPRELLQDAGIGAAEMARGAAAIAAHPALPRVCVQLADQAQIHFEAAAGVMRRQPRASVRTPRIMGAVYQALLARLRARGWAAPRRAVKVGKLERVGILLRHAVV